MSKENDRLLELIGSGDTLQAVNRLFAEEPGSDGRLALNRALYTGGEAGSEEIRAADAEHRALLAGQGAEAQTTTLYNLGCFALSQDDVMEARLRFSEVLEREPQHTMARHNLAYAHELLAETDDAHREYQGVLAQNPASPLTRLNLAQLALQEGDAESALRDLEALHRDAPANMGLLLYLCRGLLQRGGAADLRRVLELLEGNAAAERYVDLQECRAYALYQQEDFEQAESAFRKLLDGDPDNAFALAGMIKVLAQRGDFAGMRSYLERYQARNPSESGAELLSDLAGA
jgi:tetratricopeptide (TPR) repeat protein